MKLQKEHKKQTLLQWTKEDLADYCIMLEHNMNALCESFDNQYHNCLKLLEDMKLVNKTYAEAKSIIKQSIHKGGGQG